MRRNVAGLASLALLCSCGPKALTLPEEIVDRASTCGVVATIEARAATTDIKAPLPFEAQTRILHYALLAGAEGESFSAERSTAVLKRMPELQEQISAGKWQELVPACRQAFPQTEVREIKLPESVTDARLQCDELGGFIGGALQSQESKYVEQLSGYRDMARNINQTLGPGLKARVGGELKAQQAERRDALGKAARLGAPSAVMEQCVSRFG